MQGKTITHAAEEEALLLLLTLVYLSLVT